MMLYPSINKIRQKADSRYTLVILAAKRARDLTDGKPPLTMADMDREKPITVAANEIDEDLITYKRAVEPDDTPDAASADSSFIVGAASGEDLEEPAMEE